jgi:hypothetical protein
MIETRCYGHQVFIIFTLVIVVYSAWVISEISENTFTMDRKNVTPIKSGSQYYIEKAYIAEIDLCNQQAIKYIKNTHQIWPDMEFVSISCSLLQQ